MLHALESGQIAQGRRGQPAGGAARAGATQRAEPRGGRVRGASGAAGGPRDGLRPRADGLSEYAPRRWLAPLAYPCLPCAWSLAQVSLSVSVRLKTGWPGVVSGSGQK